MLQRFFQQAWFILLMVFAIGWGAMSVASANSMHLIQMQQQPCAKQMVHGDKHASQMATIEHATYAPASQPVIIKLRLNNMNVSIAALVPAKA